MPIYRIARSLLRCTLLKDRQESPAGAPGQCLVTACPRFKDIAPPLYFKTWPSVVVMIMHRVFACANNVNRIVNASCTVDGAQIEAGQSSVSLLTGRSPTLQYLQRAHRFLVAFSVSRTI